MLAVAAAAEGREPGALFDDVDSGKAAKPSARPSPEVADEGTERVRSHIERIRTTKLGADVTAAYDEAKKIAPNSAKLHDAFIRRMLKFGVVALAAAPARTLVKLDPYNGTAWGVLAYFHTKRKSYLQALPKAIQAAAYAPKNPSILAAAGQLVAWYDNAPAKPKLSDQVAEALVRVRRIAAKKPKFAQAYGQVDKAYKAIQARRDKLSADIATTNSNLAGAKKEAAAINGERRKIAGSLRGLQNDIWRWERDIDDIEWEEVKDPDGKGTTKRKRRLSSRDRRRIRDLEDKIKKARKRVRELKGQDSQAHQRYKALAQKAVAWRRSVAKEKVELKREEGKVTSIFSWAPPAVDGVVVPVARTFPHSKITTPTDGDSGSSAESKLKLVGLYIKNQMYAPAAKILRQIIADQPGSEAAGKAQALLGEIQPHLDE